MIPIDHDVLADIDLIYPLEPEHWMSKNCGLWLKALPGLIGPHFYDLSPARNRSPLSTVSGGDVYSPTARGLALNTSNWRSVPTAYPNVSSGAVPRTLMTWFRMDNAAHINRQLVQWGGINSGGGRFSLWIDNGKIGTENGSAAALGTWAPDSNWHHLCAVQNGTLNTSIQVYLDSLPLAMSYNSSVIVQPDNQVGIGYLSAAGGYEFYGLLDDIRIVNRALTFAELRDIYRDSLSLRYQALRRIVTADVSRDQASSSTKFPYSILSPVM
jgi:hypothetical protein